MNQFNPFQSYSQYQQNNPYLQQTTIQTSGINWVQGIEGAKAWQMQPNNNAMLLDSENEGTFYIKTSDNVGMCNLRIFKYQEITEQQKQTNNVDLSEYVKRSELETLISNLIGEKKNEQLVQSTESKTKSGKLITQ